MCVCVSASFCVSDFDGFLGSTSVCVCVITVHRRPLARREEERTLMGHSGCRSRGLRSHRHVPPNHINTGIWDFSHFIHTTNTPVGWERGVWTPWTPGQSAIRAFQTTAVDSFLLLFWCFCKTKTRWKPGGDRSWQEITKRTRQIQIITGFYCDRDIYNYVDRQCCWSDWWMFRGKRTVYDVIVVFLYFVETS